MSKTLADEFVADLEDDFMQISNEDNDNKENEENEDENEIDEGEEENVEPMEALSYTDIKEIAKLAQSPLLKELLEKINENMKTGSKEIVGPVEEDPEYKLIVESNNMTVDIGYEITRIHKFIQDHYSKKFPELSNIVSNPLDYARVVQRLGNEMDLTKIDLSSILPAATVMVLTVTATTTSGTLLDEETIQRVMEACSLELSLDEQRKQIVEYVESRMTKIAPNLSAIVGTSVAAKLMSVAGGLTALSKLPSGNVQVLGKNRKALPGFSSGGSRAHVGFIYECDLITKSSPVVRTRAIRLVGGKCTLAARVDSFHEDPSGGIGRRFREEIEKRLEKLLEPPPPKLPKPLPAPDDKPKKRRGGKRIRKIKQKYEMTELRKQANRVAFGMEEQETFRNTGKTLGMLGIAGSGKVRMSAVDKGFFKKQKQQQKAYSGSSGATSGLSSSLAFTPVQGLELHNPEAARKVKEANEKYFGSGTMSFINKKA